MSAPDGPASARRVLVTGAAGFIGRRLIGSLAADRGDLETLVAMDVREVPSAQRAPGVEYVVGDVRDAALEDLLRSHRVDAVVHLAAIVTPGRDSTPEEEYAVDVLGTENVLRACVKTGVRQLIVTSSGAAYG
ncbi:MAG: NAD-dependent epimerase/dehydratase family protein, partial [Deltaproteobacteria bacterium]